MPRLQGRGALQHLCSKCDEDILEGDGIFCNECEQWNHIKCEHLEIHQEEAFRELYEAPYICRLCRSDDRGAFSYSMALERLHKAAKQGFEKLLMYVERERQFIKEDFTYTVAKSPKYIADTLLEAVVQEYCPAQKLKPAKVTKDGNSLFSAVSLALVGTEKLALELRVRCCIEMVVFDSFYRWQENYINMQLCAPDYTESCLNCASPGEDSCVWTLSALASVVRRCVESVYPSINGKMDMAVRILNTVFTPRSKLDEGENLRIFWGGLKKTDQPTGSWVPEWFTPLVDIPLVSMSPMVVSPYLTPSRVSGRVRKPTPKVLAITNPKVKTEIKIVVENSVEEEERDFSMPSDFTLEPTDEEFFEPKFKPEKIDLLWMDKYSYVAGGGQPLKGTAFLPAQEVFNELTTRKDVCPSIPSGRKEDVFFVVDNSRNLRYKHRRNYFQDDCGRYNQRSGTTCKSFYLLNSNNMLQQLIKDKGKYCKESKRVSAPVNDSPRGGRGRTPRGGRSRGRGGSSTAERKVTQWIPMDPQPEDSQVIILHRYYSCLDVDPTYKRRISWFTNLPDRLETGRKSFMVEYVTKPISGLMLPESRKDGLCSYPPTPSYPNSAGDADMADGEGDQKSSAADTTTADVEMTDQPSASAQEKAAEEGQDASQTATKPVQEEETQESTAKEESQQDPEGMEESVEGEDHVTIELSAADLEGSEQESEGQTAVVQESGSQTLTET